MTREEFEEKADTYEMDIAYSEYIMENCHGERVIGNGHALIEAIEDGYLWESFVESMVDE